MIESFEINRSEREQKNAKIGQLMSEKCKKNLSAYKIKDQKD